MSATTCLNTNERGSKEAGQFVLGLFSGCSWCLRSFSVHVAVEIFVKRTLDQFWTCCTSFH